jgi:hypothetical protein
VRHGAFASELPYPDRRAPRRFLVVRAARERCGACLVVPAARRGSSGLGAASDGSGRGRRTLRRAVGWCARAPAARALLRWVFGRSRLTCAGWGGWRRVYGLQEAGNVTVN